MPSLKHIYRLGIKELWSLARDPMMLFLIIFMFTGQIYIAATLMPETLNNVPIAFVDEDDSALSNRIISAFYPPQFITPVLIPLSAVDPGLDAGEYTFVLDIPPDFQNDLIAGKSPAIQLNVDATRMTQAFTGSGYIQQVIFGEVSEFVQGYRISTEPKVSLALRMRYNPNLEQSWFGALSEIINGLTMLSIILAGAALIREREHGTIEHLLVMPVTPIEIMLSKIWSMGLVVIISAGISLTVVVQGLLKIPVQGSVLLFLCAAALCVVATTSMGIFMATVARSMPQFGMLSLLVLLPLELLSGGQTPRESMPEFVQKIMLAAPSTHFVAAGQGILFRGAGIEDVWINFLAMAVIAAVFFMIALNRFRKTISLMA
ncbi:MAG: ABC transporter permease [Synergistaceae bacterium]|nr:ABC transporter permease [Syntrophaceticus sp.]MDD4751100.1 ABC transporter permease [Synergistaceae bacterium]